MTPPNYTLRPVDHPKHTTYAGPCDHCLSTHAKPHKKSARTVSPDGTQMVCWPCWELLYDAHLERTKTTTQPHAPKNKEAHR